MPSQIIINATDPEEFRVAITEDKILQDFFIETAFKKQITGNIYKGIIVGVQPSLEAAFVNFGAEKNGFLPLSEIHPEYYAIPPEVVETSNKKESSSRTGKATACGPRIQDIIKKGQEVLVQVVKEEVGNKGAALTTYLSIPGSYLVLMPGRPHRGISRKITDEKKRGRLRDILNKLVLPEEIGVILRTAGENRTKREITRDLKYLLRLWEDIKKRAKKLPAPSLVYKEQDLGIRVIRDHFTSDVKAIVVDNKDIHKTIRDFLGIISPRHRRIAKLYKGEEPIFVKYGIEDQIKSIFDKRVPLSTGAYLVIEKTEALVAIDVNSGRMTSEIDQEETAYKVNLDAASEIPRQLRLRDLGGLTVIDFIDMKDNKHKRAVEKLVREGFKKDKAKVEIGRISRFGLLEIARQHLHSSIDFGTMVPCKYCKGTGKIRPPETIAVDFLRQIRHGLCNRKRYCRILVRVSPDVANYLLNQKRNDLVKLENQYNLTITVESDPEKLPDEGTINFVTEQT